MARCALLVLLAIICVSQGLAVTQGHSHAAAARNSEGHDSQRSVAQILDTLQNLRRSLEDMSRKADGMSTAAEARCASALQFFSGETAGASAYLARLHADLQEQQAAVEEAVGTAQQVRADAAMVQRTLNRTVDMQRAASASDGGANATAPVAGMSLLTAMGENKRQTLASLQGELEVLLPGLAQMEARAADVKRRLMLRSESTGDADRLAAVLKDLCAKGERRAGEQAAARVQEQDSLDRALQALHEIVVAEQPAQSRQAAEEADIDAEGATEESLVQVHTRRHVSHYLRAAGAGDVQDYDEEVDEDDQIGTGDMQKATASDDDSSEGDATADISDSSESNTAGGEKAVSEAESGDSDEDLLSIFAAGGAGATDAAADSESSGHPAAEASESLAPTFLRGDVRPQKVSLLRPQVQQMLDRLEAGEHGPAGSQNWCGQEHAHSLLSARVVQARAEELASQAEAHSEAQEELKEELIKVNSTIAEVNKSVRAFADGIAREKQYLARNAKDQALATRILAQAVAILADLRKEQGSESAGKAAERAAKALDVAKTSLDMQAKAVQPMLSDLAKGARAVQQDAAQTLAALRKESKTLVFARDAHGAEHARSLEEKQMYDAERRDIEKYTRSLAKECSLSTGKVQEHVVAAEIHALQDARKVLDGGSLEVQAPEAIDEDASGSAGIAEAAGAESRSLPSGTGSDASLSPLERAAATMGLAVDSN